MKANYLTIASLKSTPHRGGFTLTELLVILAVIALLICLRLPALARATNQTKRAQCAANLRQFTLAVQIYAGEYNDKLPAFSPGGYWPWDLPWKAGDLLNRFGANWRVLYCPGTAPRFTDDDNFEFYNFAPPNYRVLGYASTFPSDLSDLISSNVNVTLTPQPIQVGFGKYVTPLPSERVLLADATISAGGQSDESLRDTYNYTEIRGGYAWAHVSPHLNGKLPAGGNLGMLDGHVEWRRFADMHVRTTGSSPVFWW